MASYNGMSIKEIENMKAHERRKKKRKQKMMIFKIKVITLLVLSFVAGIMIAFKIYS